MHVLHSVPLLKHFEHCSKILTSVRVIALVQSRVAITTGYCDPVWMVFLYIYMYFILGVNQNSKNLLVLLKNVCKLNEN